MFNKVGYFCLILSLSGVSYLRPKAPKNVLHDQKVVAWDIHDVLCTKPIKHGWQCKPNPETFQVVNALHKRGVKQVIFSNISKQSFCKLVRLYPQHFRYFDLSQSMANAKGIFTRKPHAKYIKKFLKKNNVVPANIIFFDDKANNIVGARQCGINAHVFKSADPAIEILRKNHLV